MNNPETGLPPAAIGAVITYHGLIGVLFTITEINRDALNYVKSVYHDLNRVQLNEDIEAYAYQIDTTKFGESLDEVESMFLKDMYLL